MESTGKQLRLTQAQFSEKVDFFKLNRESIQKKIDDGVGQSVLAQEFGMSLSTFRSILDHLKFTKKQPKNPPKAASSPQASSDHALLKAIAIVLRRIADGLEIQSAELDQFFKPKEGVE